MSAWPLMFCGEERHLGIDIGKAPKVTRLYSAAKAGSSACPHGTAPLRLSRAPIRTHFVKGCRGTERTARESWGTRANEIPYKQWKGCVGTKWKVCPGVRQNPLRVPTSWFIYQEARLTS